jgi:hypothetical protein
MVADAGSWQGMLDRRFADGLRWAQWAVERWETFPVSLVPRPLVLVGPRLKAEGGFRSGDAKHAFLAGRFEWPDSVPERLKAAATAAAEFPDGRSRSLLEIVSIEAGETEFSTDRGRVRLAAWRLAAPDALGSIWLLDPGVRDWQPSSDPPPPPELPAPAHDPSAEIQVGPDDRTVILNWLGSLPGLERYDQAEAVESEHAVACVARGTDVGPPGPRVAAGYVHRVPARLREPLGARVFVDLHGRARVAR